MEDWGNDSDSKNDFWVSFDVHWLRKNKPFNFLCFTSEIFFIIYISSFVDLYNSLVIIVNSSSSLFDSCDFFPFELPIFYSIF